MINPRDKYDRKIADEFMKNFLKLNMPYFRKIKINKLLNGKEIK